MTVDHRPRRAQIVPGWALRAWARVADATDGIVWLIGLSVFLSGCGFAFFPVDLHDRNQARALQSRGEWVTAQEVQVRVDYVSGKGGGYSEVDGVRVRLRGSRDKVDLENVNAEVDSIWEDIGEGWQDPTSITGYEPPLTVRVQRDSDGAIVSAMAKDDYEYWTQDNSDPEFGLTLGVGGLAATVLFLILNSLRLKWQIKRGRARRVEHETEHRDRVAATGKRGRA